MRSNNLEKKIFYRPEIDGLRSIAVISVILYHAQIVYNDIKLFSGGFIGVDIFFVISGYLITKIIFDEIHLKKTFSLKNFYARRVRRIIPALLFVILLSLPFAWVFLLPNSLIDYANSIISSLTFSSNYYFWHSGQQYGTASGLLKPFLHTWSLSVEEQFYIFFPILLLFIFKFFKKYILLIFIIIFFSSLFFSNWGSKNISDFNFYFTYSRIWEIVAGSLVAYFQVYFNYSNKNLYLRHLMPSFGMILIGTSIFYFNFLLTHHPSFQTMIPVLGCCIFIWFAHKDEIVTKLLSTKLFVGIGLISYSLYLWHYPIFAFARITQFASGDILKKILVLSSIFILSIISFYLVEKPARGKKFKFRYLLFFIGLVYVFLISFNLNILTKNGIVGKYNNLGSFKFIKPWEQVKNQKDEFCHSNIDGCVFNEKGKNKIILIGDSHAASLSYDLKNKLTKKDYSFQIFTKGGCLLFPGFSIFNKKDNSKSDCDNDYFKNLVKELNTNKNTTIIISGAYPNYFNLEKFDNEEGGIVDGNKQWGRYFEATGEFVSTQDSLTKTIEKLAIFNNIIIVYPIPEVGFNVPQLILKKMNDKKIYSILSTSYEVYKKRSKTSFNILDNIKKKEGEGNIFRVFPHKIFCNTEVKNRCITNNQNKIFYFDDNHLSIDGSKLVNNEIIKIIEQLNDY